MPLLEDRSGDVGSDLRLGATDPEPLADPRVHTVDRGAGRAQLRELGRVLAHPQLAQDRAGELLVRRPGVTQAQQVQGRCHVGHRDATGRHSAERQGVGVLAVDRRAHLDAELAERHVTETGVLERRETKTGATVASLGTTSAVSRSNDEPAMPVR